MALNDDAPTKEAVKAFLLKLLATKRAGVNGMTYFSQTRRYTETGLINLVAKPSINSWDLDRSYWGERQHFVNPRNPCRCEDKALTKEALQELARDGFIEPVDQGSRLSYHLTAKGMEATGDRELIQAYHSRFTSDEVFKSLSTPTPEQALTAIPPREKPKTVAFSQVEQVIADVLGTDSKAGQKILAALEKNPGKPRS